MQIKYRYVTEWQVRTIDKFGDVIDMEFADNSERKVREFFGKLELDGDRVAAVLETQKSRNQTAKGYEWDGDMLGLPELHAVKGSDAALKEGEWIL